MRASRGGHCALALLVAAAVAPGCARADWIDPGIAYRCDADAGGFSLAATMTTSAPEMPGEVGVPEGHVPLSKAHDDLAVSCKLGQARVRALIHIIRARERGQCSSFEFVDIVQLQVDGKALLEHALFNGGCHAEPVLHRIEIRATGMGLRLKTCRAPWNWDAGYSPDACEEREITSPGEALPN